MGLRRGRGVPRSMHVDGSAAHPRSELERLEHRLAVLDRLLRPRDGIGPCRLVG
jgi:hypothetical protein